MARPSSWLLALAALACISACERQRDPDPISKRDPVGVELIQPDTRDAMNRFSLNLLRERGKRDSEPFGLATASIYQNLAILTNAAQGQTLADLSKVIGVERDSRKELNDAQMALIDRLRAIPQRPFQLNQAIFMIWPIPIRKDFEAEIALAYGARVTKLGGAGLSTVGFINEWSAEATRGRVTSLIKPDELDKSQMFLGYAAFSGGQSEAGAEGLVATSLPSLPASAEAFAKGKRVALESRSVDDVSKELSAMGLKSLFDGPINLSSMSVELRGDYKMAAMRSVMDIELSGSGSAASGEWWALIDTKTGIILAGGRG